MSDYGQKPGIAPDLKFSIEGKYQTGSIVYHHPTDVWVLKGRYGDRIGSINANHYGTVREFKVWAKYRLDKEGVPE